jgi:hypothetical protein
MKKGILLVGSLTLTLIVAGLVTADTDQHQDISFHPFTLDGGNSTCVSYDDPEIGSTRNCDPVNLFFAGMIIQDVRAVLEEKLWTTSGFGSSQSLHYEEGGLFNQDLQLYLNESDNRRYHVRLWQIPGEAGVLGAVHHEQGVIFHTIDMSWEAAEASIADQLCGDIFICGNSERLPLQVTIQNAQSGQENAWRDWENNGVLTVISRVTDRVYLPLVSTGLQELSTLKPRYAVRQW